MATRLRMKKKLNVSLLIGNLILYKNCEHEHSMRLAIKLKPTRVCMENCNIYIYKYIPLTYMYQYVYKLCVPFLILSINYIELHCYA